MCNQLVCTNYACFLQGVRHSITNTTGTCTRATCMPCARRRRSSVRVSVVLVAAQCGLSILSHAPRQHKPSPPPENQAVPCRVCACMHGTRGTVVFAQVHGCHMLLKMPTPGERCIAIDIVGRSREPCSGYGARGHGGCMWSSQQ